MLRALQHPLMLPRPITQLAPLRPKEVRGLAQGPTVGQKPSWNSNSRAGPTAGTPITVINHQETRVVMKIRAGRRLECSREVHQGPTPPLLGFLSTSHLPRFLHCSCRSTGTPVMPVRFHRFLRWSSKFRSLLGRTLRVIPVREGGRQDWDDRKADTQWSCTKTLSGSDKELWSSGMAIQGVPQLRGVVLRFVLYINPSLARGCPQGRMCLWAE